MPLPRLRSAAQPLVQLDRQAAVPVRLQLERELRRAVQSGRLPAGSRLPSTRLLASDLGLSRGVVVEVYEQLLAEGYFTARHGWSTRVAGRRASLIARFTARARDGKPALRSPARTAGSVLVSAPGLDAVRAAIAHRGADRDVRLSGPSRRGIGSRGPGRVCEPRTGDSGSPRWSHVHERFGAGHRVGLSRPSRTGHWLGRCRGSGAAEQCTDIHDGGLKARRMPVDARGLPTGGWNGPSHVVLVTPAPQFPTGACSARIAGPRYSSGPSGRKRDHRGRLRRGISATTGSPSARSRDSTPTASPTRVGQQGPLTGAAARMARGTGGLVAGVTEAKRRADRGSSVLEQVPFADFLDRGELDRHLRRARPIYRERRDALVRR